MDKLRFACLLLSLATAASILATCAPAPLDPLLGGGVAEAAATADYLWVRDAGAVVQLRRSDGAHRVLAKDGIVDMDRSRGRLLGLRALDADGRRFQVLDLTTGGAPSPSIALPSPPLALIADDAPTLVTEGALYRLDGRSWRRQALSKTLRPTPALQPRAEDTNAVFSGAGVIYVGFDFGEFGGGMSAIDPATGAVSEVTAALPPERAKILAKLLPGSRWPSRLPLFGITSVARDAARPDCILATEGLQHMLSANGQLLRVCGADAETVFSQRIELSDAKQLGLGVNASEADPPRDTWPLYSVGAAPGGWVAIAPGYLFRSSRGVVTRSKLPQFRNWRGILLVSLGADFIILPGNQGAFLVPVTQ